MPSTAAITRSIGVVMNPRTRPALAPTYTVVICTTAMSLRGYWRTLSERMDCSPAITITRLTTMARTGRLINRSVNFIELTSVSGCRLAVRRLGRRTIFRLNRVVDLHLRAVAQFENARGYNFLSRVYARDNRDLVAAGVAQFYELLLHSAIGFAGWILHVRDYVHGITVGRVVDRRDRKSDDCLVRSGHDCDLHEHAGMKFCRRIRNGRLHLHVPRSLVDNGVDRRDASGKLSAHPVVARDVEGSADARLEGSLLRHAEVHINRIQRLQRDDGLTGSEVLSEIDLANAQNTGERSVNRFSRDCGTNLAYIGFGGVLLRRNVVGFLPRRDALLHELLGAVEIDFREIALRFGSGELGALLARVEFNQNISDLYRLA